MTGPFTTRRSKRLKEKKRVRSDERDMKAFCKMYADQDPLALLGKELEELQNSYGPISHFFLSDIPVFDINLYLF